MQRNWIDEDEDELQIHTNEGEVYITCFSGNQDAEVAVHLSDKAMTGLVGFLQEVLTNKLLEVENDGN